MSGREAGRRFHFIREIATGGFGTVYLAKVVHGDGFSRLVAVKLLKAQWSDNADVVRRIRDEARLLGLLRHRNIVDVLDLTSLDGRTAVVMEYLEAVDFRTVAMHLHDQGQRMSVRAALEAIALVASALDAAYNRPPIPGEKPLRVIHRDIKPSNIMVDETGMVKVLDFGVARSDIENRESFTQELQFGSVDYMAPERLFFEPETPASDVYSLGATLYEILALEKLGKARGRPEKHAAFLHERMSFLHLQTGLPDAAMTELENLLLASLDFTHEQRPTAAEFFQRTRALARLMTDEDLGQWAERLLPGLIRAAGDAAVEPGNLQDVVLPEDSIAVSRSSVAVGLAESAKLGVGVGDQLRRGALAELDDSRSFSSVVLRSDASGPKPINLMAPIDTVVPSGPEVWDDGATDLDVRPKDPPALATDEPTQLGNALLLGPEVTERSAPRLDLPRGPLDLPQAGGPGSLTDAPEPAHLSGPTLSLEPPPLSPPPGPALIGPAPRDLPITQRDFDQLRARSPAHSLPAVGPAPGPSPAPGGPAMLPPIAVNHPAASLPPIAISAPAPATTPSAPPPRAATATAPPSFAGAPPMPASSRSPAISGRPGGDADRAGEAEEEPFEPPARRRSVLPMAFLSGCLAGLVILGAGAAVWLVNPGDIRSKLRPASARTAAAAPAVQVSGPSLPAVASGPAIHFVSAAADTKSITVDCKSDDGAGKGTEAVVAAASAEHCMVSVVLMDRSRLRALVEKAEQGTYRCFEGGAEVCERK